MTDKMKSFVKGILLGLVSRAVMPLVEKEEVPWNNLLSVEGYYVSYSFDDGDAGGSTLPSTTKTEFKVGEYPLEQEIVVENTTNDTSLGISTTEWYNNIPVDTGDTLEMVVMFPYVEVEPTDYDYIEYYVSFWKGLASTHISCNVGGNNELSVESSGQTIEPITAEKIVDTDGKIAGFKLIAKGDLGVEKVHCSVYVRGTFSNPSIRTIRTIRASYDDIRYRVIKEE